MASHIAKRMRAVSLNLPNKAGGVMSRTGGVAQVRSTKVFHHGNTDVAPWPNAGMEERFEGKSPFCAIERDSSEIELEYHFLRIVSGTVPCRVLGDTTIQDALRSLLGKRLRDVDTGSLNAIGCQAHKAPTGDALPYQNKYGGIANHKHYAAAPWACMSRFALGIQHLRKFPSLPLLVMTSPDRGPWCTSHEVPQVPIIPITLEAKVAESSIPYYTRMSGEVAVFVITRTNTRFAIVEEKPLSIMVRMAQTEQRKMGRTPLGRARIRIPPGPVSGLQKAPAKELGSPRSVIRLINPKEGLVETDGCFERMLNPDTGVVEQTAERVVILKDRISDRALRREEFTHLGALLAPWITESHERDLTLSIEEHLVHFLNTYTGASRRMVVISE